MFIADCFIHRVPAGMLPLETWSPWASAVLWARLCGTMFSRSPPSQDPEKVSASSKCDIEIKSTCGKKKKGENQVLYLCVCVCVIKMGSKKVQQSHAKKKKKQPSSGGSTRNNACDSEENVIDIVIQVWGILFTCHLRRRHFWSTLWLGVRKVCH